MRPDASGLLIAGQPGVGKSRLAAECMTIAERAGFRCVRVIATRAAAAVPLGAFVPLLPGTVTAAAPDLHGDVLRQAADAILGDGSGPLLLVVDDAHLLDNASATVVQQLAEPDRAFVVLTTRTGELPPEPLVSLWKDGVVERLELEPLTPEDVDGLLDQILEGPIDGVCRRDLWEASQGNVLFLRELVIGALEKKILRRERGVWRLVHELASTPRLVELVEARLAEVSPERRGVLELLALGEPLPLAHVLALTELAVVEELERRTLVETVGQGAKLQLRLAHPLHAEVLRQRLSPLRRMVASRRLADTAGPETDLLRTAVWRLDGGGSGSPGVMLAAARQAHFSHDRALAERLARAAYDAGAGLPAGLLLAQVLGEQGRQDERIELLTSLEPVAETHDERAMVVMERAFAQVTAATAGQDPDAGLAALEASLPAGDVRDEIRAHRATLASLAGRPRDALRLLPAARIAEYARRPAAKAAFATAPALLSLGRYDEAIAVAARGYDAYVALGDLEVMSELGVLVATRAAAYQESGRLDEARAIVDSGYAEAVASGARVGQAWCSLLRGSVAVTCGELRTAAAAYAESAAVFADLHDPGPRRWALAGRALSHAQLGEAREAAAAIRELDEFGESSMLLRETDVCRGRGLTFAMEGHRSKARSLLLEGVTIATTSHASGLGAAVCHDLARIGFASDALVPLEKFAPHVDGALVGAMLRHVRGLVDDDAEELEAATCAFESCGALLYAAEAAAAASAVHRRRSSVRQAEALAARSRTLSASCQGAKTPALELAGATSRLTTREREIARMAANGLASKEIAERLYLSVRTVDSHLQRVYLKLGLRGRGELAAALPARPSWEVA